MSFLRTKDRCTDLVSYRKRIYARYQSARFCCTWEV